MVRTLYCTRCGATRTLDTVRPHVAAGAPLTCFSCAGIVFTVGPSRVLRITSGFMLTRRDRCFLKGLGIATVEAMTKMGFAR